MNRADSAAPQYRRGVTKMELPSYTISDRSYFPWLTRSPDPLPRSFLIFSPFFIEPLGSGDFDRLSCISTVAGIGRTIRSASDLSSALRNPRLEAEQFMESDKLAKAKMIRLGRIFSPGPRNKIKSRDTGRPWLGPMMRRRCIVVCILSTPFDSRSCACGCARDAGIVRRASSSVVFSD